MYKVEFINDIIENFFQIYISDRNTEETKQPEICENRRNNVFTFKKENQENDFYNYRREFQENKNAELLNSKKDFEIQEDKNKESFNFYQYFTLKNTLVCVSIIGCSALLIYYSPDIINFFFSKGGGDSLSDSDNTDKIVKKFVSGRITAGNPGLVLPKQVRFWQPYRECDVIRYRELSLARSLEFPGEFPRKQFVFVDHMYNTFTDYKMVYLDPVYWKDAE